MGQDHSKGKSKDGKLFDRQEDEIAERFDLKPFKFDSKSKKWEPTGGSLPAEIEAIVKKRKQENEKGEDKESIQLKESLVIVTYNVWFAETCRKERFSAIFDILHNLNADVICLQEVIPYFVKQMLEVDWVREGYYVSDITGKTFDFSYGVLIMSRIPMESLSIYALNSAMARKALVGSYIINGEATQIATVHLESLNSARARKQQLKTISDLLKDSQHAALVGDFNFDSERNFNEGVGELENKSLAEFYPEYLDTWQAVHPDKRGYTFDSDVNVMLKHEERMRYDRIMWKSTESKWRVEDVQLFGTNACTTDEKGDPIFPSDHFGVCCTLKYSA